MMELCVIISFSIIREGFIMDAHIEGSLFGEG